MWLKPPPCTLPCPSPCPSHFLQPVAPLCLHAAVASPQHSSSPTPRRLRRATGSDTPRQRWLRYSCSTVCVHVCVCVHVLCVCRPLPQLSAAAGVSCALYSFGACTASQGLLTLLHQGVLSCLSVCVPAPPATPVPLPPSVSPHRWCVPYLS